MVSDEQLIEDLREFADELGKTPTYQEMREKGPWSTTTYENHFGSWNEALETAGLEINCETVVKSREQLIEDLQGFADELEKTPTYKEMREKGPWSGKTYENHFGSWSEALEAAGLETNKGVQCEQPIKDLREFADELGKTPTISEMIEKGPWSGKTYENYFGSWNAALEAAGLEPNKEDVSREQLIGDLREFVGELGKTPTRREMEEKGPWGAVTYERHFGSWNEALGAAGLEPNKEMNISREQLIEDLRAFAEELGKTPTISEMDEKGQWDSSTYQSHFGSWNTALETAGLDINRPSPQELAGTGEHAYGRGWHQKRQETIERDGGKCRVCGADKTLNVHHITPRREFEDVSDSNTLDNLITLCPSCHGRFEGKWKDATPDEFAEKAKAFLSSTPYV